jgi:hypothetical protein
MTHSRAKKYLDAVKVALVNGEGWQDPKVCEDVVKIAHLLRCLKLLPKLATSYLFIRHPMSGMFVILRIEEAPHANICKLREGEAVEYRKGFWTLIEAVNTEVSHLPFVKLLEGCGLELNVYFRGTCDRLMRNEGWSNFEDLPRLIAKKAKTMGLSATNNNFTCFIRVPEADTLVGSFFEESSSERPKADDIKRFLALRGMSTADDAVKDFMSRCEKLFIQSTAENAHGRPDDKCKNPQCQKVRAMGEKRKVCSKCSRVTYCSRECQKADWRRHKSSCFEGVVLAYSPQEYVKDIRLFEERYGSKLVFA